MASSQNRNQTDSFNSDGTGTERDSSGWSAAQYNSNASFVYSKAFTSAVVGLLDPKPGEKILDLGCGSGEVTIELAKIVESAEGGLVVGTDASESMIVKAKANGLQHAFVSDIQDEPFPANASISLSGATTDLAEVNFDAVFSNATLHWCKRDPLGVLKGARKVLKEGGRFVAEMGGFLNCVGVRSAMHQVLRRRGYDPIVVDPWFFPTPEEYTKLLESASFKVHHISLNPRLTPLPNRLYDWLNLFARASFLKDVKEEEARDIMEEVERMCEVDCKDESRKWMMMYVRLRVVATVV